MAENLDWVPYSIGTTVPNAARVYDYWLNGAHNFAADRVMGHKIEQVMPGVRDAVRKSRWADRDSSALPERSGSGVSPQPRGGTALVRRVRPGRTRAGWLRSRAALGTG